VEQGWTGAVGFSLVRRRRDEVDKRAGRGARGEEEEEEGDRKRGREREGEREQRIVREREPGSQALLHVHMGNHKLTML
jgi:hypothetical protein